MTILTRQPLRLLILLICFALPAAAVAFPPDTSIKLDPGQNGPFTPPAAGPDWYHFSLDSYQAVTLYSNRPAAAIEGIEPAGTLMNSDGEVLAEAEDNAPNEQFRIEENLPAGTYYLKVNAPMLIPRDDESSSYELFLE
ncbi:MAG: hypothetical protein R3280_11360 [Marinobacter sp.]|uniref:hypothetical protein n=1 Tax=Marinobacter sp. TaxID=50741 RepID=UPI00299EC41D|nr:hypothetical protein [Marinobacter sp.]MDX1635230.1 hypothetical protein [Marinobacter sp.]